MKTKLLILILSFLPILNLKSQIRVKGKVVIFNSKYWNKGKSQIPVANVSIKASCCAKPTISDINGNYSLQFGGLRENDTIKLQFDFEDMEVINANELVFKPIDDKIVNIYVISKREFEYYKTSLVKEATSNIEKRYVTLFEQMKYRGHERDSILSLLAQKFNKPNLSYSQAIYLLNLEKNKEKD